MRITQKIFLLFFLLTFQVSKAQIFAGNDTLVPCGSSATLNATVTGSYSTASYTFNIIPFTPYPYTGTSITLSDDAVSGALPIGFTFCFLGNNYTQFYIGSNGWISFSPGQPATFTSTTIPNTGGNVPKNCIMGPWQDWHPGIAGGPYIFYQTVGTAPNRKLVVSYVNIPMFSCTSNLGTFQIVCHETTNLIENFIGNKPNCPAWAGGTATQGVHNATGTLAYTVPGRNSTQWTTTNEGTEFRPNGVTWFQVGGPQVGIGQSITVTPNGTTAYAAVVSLCDGTTYSDTVIVTVGNTVISAGNDTSICLGGGVQLSTGPATNHVWSPSTGLSCTNCPAPIASPQSTTTYIVSALVNGCPAQDTITVFVNPPPTVIADSSWTCIGTQATLNANASVPGGNFVWNPGNLSGQNVIVSPVVGQNTYVVAYSLQGCVTVYDTVNVTLVPLPEIIITAQQNPICSGTSTVLTANGGVSYVWQLSPNISDTIGAGVIVNPPVDERFRVRGIDANGCSDTASVFINVFPELSIVASNDTAICFGDTTKILFASASGGNGGSYTYTWLPSNSLTFISDTLVKAHPTVTTSYIIIASDNCTVLPAVDSITVTINPLPLVNIDTDTTQGCLPLKINFKNLTTPAPASCFWNFGNGKYSTTCGDQVNTYKEEGIFSVSLLVTDVNGCKNKLENYPISVFPLPKADFLYTPQPVNVLDQFTQFVDTSSSDVITWWWDFGGLGYDSIQHPYFKFEEAGEYPVKQVVMNNYGCYDSITRILTVNDNLSLWIPNSFTPGNKDGLNDGFMPLGLSVYNGNFELRIFNRWGEEIFRTNDVSNPWKGENCQAGVYTWRIDIIDPQGKSIVKYGHLNLIR